MKKTLSVWQFAASRWTIYVAVFIVPLYVSLANWFPFVTPKETMAIGLSMVASIFFLWGLWQSPEERVGWSGVHWFLLGFLAVLVVAGLHGIDPHLSFFGTFHESTSIILLIALAAFAIIIGEFVRRDMSIIRNLCIAILSSGVIVAFISFFGTGNPSSVFLKLTHLGSTLGNSSFAGTVLLFAIGAGLYLWVQGSVRVRSVVGACILLILACPIFLNADVWHGGASLAHPFSLVGEAQGALLGVGIVIVGTVALLLTRRSKKALQYIGVAILLMGACAVSSIYIQYLAPDSKIHHAIIEQKAGNRFLYATIAQQGLHERPLLGWGFQNFQYVYQSHFDPIVFQKGYYYEQWVTNPHNIIYDMGVSAGYLGILAYLILFGGLCIIAYRHTSNHKAMAVIPALLIGYFVQNLFILDTPTSWMLFFVCIGIVIGVDARAVKYEIPKPLLALKMAVLAVAFVLFAWLPARESRAFARLKDGDTTRILGQVQRISLEGATDDDAWYAMTLLGKLDVQRGKLASADRPAFLQNITNAVNQLAVDIAGHPKHVYAPYAAGQLLHLYYIVDPSHATTSVFQAQEYLMRAESLSPTNPKIHFALAQNALFRNNVTEAIVEIKAGLTLDPNSEPGYALADSILKKVPNKEFKSYIEKHKFSQ